ncbi:MAG TPA: ATP-binding protein, partial [Candidatus Binatia bacterium]
FHRGAAEAHHSVAFLLQHLLAADQAGMRIGNFLDGQIGHTAHIIVTSQVEPEGWLKLFEDPVIAEAIVDRLIHPSQKIILKGEKSYREKLAEKKTGLKNQGGSS